MNLKLDQIKTGHEVWCEANTRVNARLQAARQLLERSQQAEIIDVEVNMDDINKLFEERSHGKHMLELEFEPTTPGSVTEPSNRTGNPTTVWIWKHKLTGAEVRRYQTSSKKGWDTAIPSEHQGIKEPGRIRTCTTHLDTQFDNTYNEKGLTAGQTVSQFRVMRDYK
jgi:hypothetical protein